MSFLKVTRRIHTLKLMKFMFKCCTESVLMKFVFFTISWIYLCDSPLM